MQGQLGVGADEAEDEQVPLLGRRHADEEISNRTVAVGERFASARSGRACGPGNGVGVASALAVVGAFMSMFN
jgi:hypothetical protein